MCFRARAGRLAAALSIGLAGLAGATPNTFRDPLDTPAAASRIAAQAMYSDVARVAEGRFVAVGRRGMIVRSSDGGASWQQAPSPVSTDLLSLSFADEKQGWAVGHGGDEEAKRSLQEAERFKADGPGRPLLAVRFSDALRGMAVGAYNLAIRTEDGGRTWRSIASQLDNPRGMHLYGIAEIDGRLWIAGEQGVLLKQETRQDGRNGRFAQVKTPYPGSFFGIAGKAGEVVVYGLRGNALRSSDGGASWTALQTGTQSNLTAGTVLPDGRLVLAAMNGELLLSADDSGAAFTRLPQAQRSAQFALAAGRSALVMAGARGVATLPVPARNETTR
ncbi:YCF48-related protein [Pelomonas sp. KK5]|uniref:YCF48-related protein n=1 Tax=Pelomonas sp. KK5 TaxID=1855730 RepID=UPI00097BB9C7|nr:YCF48-related protein [Pelomonas sp. KK5]